MADQVNVNAADDIKKDAARITTHSASDLKAYKGVDVEYMNFSSVARKPFEAKDSKQDETPKQPSGLHAPKAPGSDNK